jgi:hypothetical protein
MSDQSHHGDHHEHNHDHRGHDHDHDNGDHQHEHGLDEEALREQFKRLRVADLAYEMMVGLVTVGYQKLGLTSHTRDLRDLGDAHLAIELLRAALDVVERDADRDQFKDVRATLAQMQLGYAQVLQSDGPARAEQAAESEAQDDESGASPATSDDEPAAGSR